MSQFSRQTGMTQEQLAIADHARTNAGADREINHVAAALGRPFAGFGQSRHIGIVAEINGQLNSAAIMSRKGTCQPAGQVGRRDHQARQGIQRTRR